MKLKLGEELCPVCDGQGKVLDNFCSNCLATGKLDWLEKITGKNIDVIMKGMESKFGSVLKDYIFEPNDETTRAHISNEIDSYLKNIDERRDIYKNYEVEVTASTEQIDKGEFQVNLKIKL